MSIALWGLIGLAVLVFVHIGVDSFLLKGSVGNAWTMGPRDVAPRPGRFSGRARRALWNFIETAPAFLALALVAELAERTGELVSWGIVLYLVGRVLYLPAYVSGLPYLRTLCWLVATGGLALMFVGVLA